MAPSRRPLTPWGPLRTVGVASSVVLLVAGAPAAADSRASAREAAALELLERAVLAARTVGYSGTQYVASWSGDSSTSTLAEVAHDPARGAAVVTAAAAGGERTAVPLGPTRLDRTLLDVLAAEYDLVVASTGRCTGRVASVVEARRAGVRGDGSVAGRLWLDRESGLLLRREVYDDAGRRVRSSAFVDVAITSAAVDPPDIRSAYRSADGAGSADRRPARLTAREDTDSALTRLRSDGWLAPDRLPRGFALVDVRVRDVGGAPAVAHLTYTDGLSTLSLFAQRGQLGEGPGGSFTTGSMGGGRVWIETSTPERVVWSGGDQVWTLVADAPREAVEAAVSALPHDAPARGGVLARLGRGLARLAGVINPFA